MFVLGNEEEIERMCSTPEKHFTPTCETNQLSESQNTFGLGQIEFLLLQISCVLNWLSGDIFSFVWNTRWLCFSARFCSLFLKTSFIDRYRGVRLAQQKNLHKSMISMLDCFPQINHVTPFRFISVQAPISASSQASNNFIDEGSSFAPSICW